MTHKIEWTEYFSNTLESYFKEDDEGVSQHRIDYYDDDLPLANINGYIVNLYHCPPKERWKKTNELIPPKWYGEILRVLKLTEG